MSRDSTLLSSKVPASVPARHVIICNLNASPKYDGTFKGRCWKVAWSSELLLGRGTADRHEFDERA